MEQTTFIFEGELVRTVGYFNQDSSRVFRTSLLRLTRTVQGTLHAGTVQVVYPGPRIAGVSKEKQHGETLVLLSDYQGHGPDAQGMDLPAGKPIVFFCRAMPARFAPKPPRLPTGNPTALEIVGLAYDAFRDGSVSSDVGGRFADLPTLYHYLNTHYHVPLPVSKRRRG